MRYDSFYRSEKNCNLITFSIKESKLPDNRLKNSLFSRSIRENEAAGQDTEIRDAGQGDVSGIHGNQE